MNALAAGFALIVAATNAHSAPFADPFRPPQQARPPAPEGDMRPGVGGTRLESVLIGPDRRIAVIAGQRYAEGDKFGDGRVLRISETEVVIRHAGRDEALKLFPDSARRSATARAGGKRK